jgi:hypothetical protein
MCGSGAVAPEGRPMVARGEALRTPGIVAAIVIETRRCDRFYRPSGQRRERFARVFSGLKCRFCQPRPKAWEPVGPTAHQP